MLPLTVLLLQHYGQITLASCKVSSLRIKLFQRILGVIDILVHFDEGYNVQCRSAMPALITPCYCQSSFELDSAMMKLLFGIRISTNTLYVPQRLQLMKDKFLKRTADFRRIIYYIRRPMSGDA